MVPVLVGDGSKTAYPGDLFDHSPDEMIRDCSLLSPEGVVLVSSSGTESS